MWPIWLLDIDGVVNAFDTRAWPEDQWMQVIVTDSRPKDWTITAAQPVLDFITKVHEGKWAEIVWLTTWQEDANKVSDALFLPHFRHIPNPMWKNTRHAGPQWWKLTEAMRVYLQGRPTIWTDDDISQEIRSILNKGTDGTLVISPSTNEGLAPVHLDKIAKFLGMPWGQ